MWFKLFYVIVFCVSVLAIGYLGRDNAVESPLDFPFYLYFVGAPFMAIFLFFVMIFDALRIEQTSKSIFSVLAVFFFSIFALQYRRILNFPDSSPLSGTSKVRFPDPLGYETVTISFLELAGNSSNILMIFLARQLFYSLFWPQCATVIHVTPVISFQSVLGCHPDVKKTKRT